MQSSSWWVLEHFCHCRKISCDPLKSLPIPITSSSTFYILNLFFKTWILMVCVWREDSKFLFKEVKNKKEFEENARPQKESVWNYQSEQPVTFTLFFAIGSKRPFLYNLKFDDKIVNMVCFNLGPST